MHLLLMCAEILIQRLAIQRVVHLATVAVAVVVADAASQMALRAKIHL
jgi:hypothetical protein